MSIIHTEDLLAVTQKIASDYLRKDSAASTYLSLSGGTLTSAFDTFFRLKTTGANGIYLEMEVANGTKGWYGMDHAGQPLWHDSAAHTIIHSGNIANQSVNSSIYSDYATNLSVQDTRWDDLPTTGDRVISAHFKSNGADGLYDNGVFHLSLLLKQWYDGSGGLVHNLAFTDGGNMWMRNADDGGTWGNWRRFGYADEFLPLTGGTMSGKIIIPSAGTGAYGGAIEIREYGSVSTTQSDWDYAPRLTFHWAGRHVQTFGVRSDGAFAIDDSKILLHSGNYSSYALPLAGGRMNAGAEITFNAVHSSADQWINFACDGLPTVKLGIRRPYDVHGPSYFDGANYYKLYHSGNLDITSIDSVFTTSQGYRTLDLRGYDEDTWFPCSMRLGADYMTEITIWVALNSNVPSWATHPNGFSMALRWEVNGHGWGTIPISRTVKCDTHNHTVDNVPPCGGITQNGQYSYEIVFLRGGAVYYYHTSDASSITPHNGTYVVGSEEPYRWEYPARSVNEITATDNDWTDSIFKVRDLSAKAITAGSGLFNGALTTNGNLTTYGVFTGASSGSFGTNLTVGGGLYVADKVGIGTDTPLDFMEVRGNAAAIRISSLSAPSIYYTRLETNYDYSNTTNLYGGYGGHRLLNAWGTSMSLNPDGGFVGVGRTDPQTTLDVNGDIRSQERVYIGTSGAYLWYDAANNCIRTNVNFAADGDITAGA